MEFAADSVSPFAQNLNVLPDPTSELAERIQIFTGYLPYNTTAVNTDAYNTILTELYIMHAKPALWFFGAAVNPSAS